MTVPQSTTAGERSLGRPVLAAAQYYLGNRWTLIALGAVAIVLGLAFGGWGWLVAAGLAPIILSTLPCLIMCGLGVCVMCLSGRKASTTQGDAVDAATSSSALGIAKMAGPPIGTSSCCEADGHETPANGIAEGPTTQTREQSHA